MVRISGARRRLMAEAVVWLSLAGLALLVLRFRTIASHLGQTLTPAEAASRIAETSTAADASALVSEIGWAVRCTAGHLPFRAHCLQQAVAAKYMLRRRSIVGALHLGVATRQGPEGEMTVHAWLDAAGVDVTGGPVTAEYTEVACFL